MNSSSGSHFLSRFLRYLFKKFSTPYDPLALLWWVGGWVGGAYFAGEIALFKNSKIEVLEDATLGFEQYMLTSKMY